MIANHKMIILRNNHIPKGLIPLEKLFDKYDVFVKPTIHPQKRRFKVIKLELNKNQRISSSQNFYLLMRKSGMLICLNNLLKCFHGHMNI